MDPLIEKVSALPIGGRITLIKLVLGSLPIHYLFLVRDAVNFINDLERIRRRFCWGMSDAKRNFFGSHWDKMLASKSNGGVGIETIGVANTVPLCKWVWFLNKERDKFWGRCISAHGLKLVLLRLDHLVPALGKI